MPKALSDTEENKLLVRGFFLNEDGSPKNDDLEDFVEDVYRSKYKIDDVLEGVGGKFRIIEAVRDNSLALAAWKAFKSASDWQYFMAELKIRGVSERNISTVRQLVEAQFILLLSEATDYAKEDENRLIIENVESYVARRGKHGIVLEIKLVEE